MNQEIDFISVLVSGLVFENSEESMEELKKVLQNFSLNKEQIEKRKDSFMEISYEAKVKNLTKFEDIFKAYNLPIAEIKYRLVNLSGETTIKTYSLEELKNVHPYEDVSAVLGLKDSNEVNLLAIPTPFSLEKVVDEALEKIKNEGGLYDTTDLYRLEKRVLNSIKDASNFIHAESKITDFTDNGIYSYSVVDKQTLSKITEDKVFELRDEISLNYLEANLQLKDYSKEGQRKLVDKLFEIAKKEDFVCKDEEIAFSKKVDLFKAMDLIESTATITSTPNDLVIYHNESPIYSHLVKNKRDDIFLASMEGIKNNLEESVKDTSRPNKTKKNR